MARSAVEIDFFPMDKENSAKSPTKKLSDRPRSVREEVAGGQRREVDDSGKGQRLKECPGRWSCKRQRLILKIADGFLFEGFAVGNFCFTAKAKACSSHGKRRRVEIQGREGLIGDSKSPALISTGATPRKKKPAMESDEARRPYLCRDPVVDRRRSDVGEDSGAVFGASFSKQWIKAENILKLAEEGVFKTVEFAYPNLAVSSIYHQSRLLENLQGDLPIARRKSLQRFLGKRKER
ncbi:hypothetical protein U1Q18_017365 [Sarracenia purpurea var. burkii]